MSFRFSIFRNDAARATSRWFLSAAVLTALLLSFGSVLADDVSSTTPPEPAVENIVVPAQSPADGEAVSIVTGDATSAAEISNVENSNIISNNPETPVTLPQTEEATADSSPGSNILEQNTGTSTLTVFDDNVGTASTAADVSASTGSNNISNTDQGAVISTGFSTAAAQISNVINTNVIDSNGLLILLNNLFGNVGNIDLRSAISSGSTGGLSSPCGSGNCGGATVTTIENNNVAEISNQVVVRSDTGANGVDGTGGDASVNTGNAYASANVVNIANTNIIDSNYLLMVFDHFGDWNGNFVLPNKDFFSNSFFNKPAASASGGSGATVSPSSTAVLNDNSADVLNSVGVAASTGDNNISDAAGTANINTGRAFSGTTVSNGVNTNLFGQSSFVVLFRVYGKWLGNVFSAPDEITWRQTPNGVELYNNSLLGGLGGSPSGSVFALGDSNSSGNGQSSSFTGDSTNSATIKNDVKVYALTGENQLGGVGGNASVNTGNAYASANVVNIANTNVIGSNWVFAIINIFGDWNGSVSFGEPDLWLGSKVDAPSGIGPNSEITYHFTIANRGDADATNVKLSDVISPDRIAFDGITSDAMNIWNIGTIPAGGTVEVSYGARVSGDLPFGQSNIENSATVTSAEKDANVADNTDHLTMVASNFPQSGSDTSGANINLTPDPDLLVVKTSGALAPIIASTTVNYTVVIKNNGGPAYRSVLVDTLKDSKGQVINRQSWDLDTIKSKEEITVTYTLGFSASTTDGVYVNEAVVHALGRSPSLDPFYGWFADSNVATSSVTVFTPPPPFASTIVPDIVTITTGAPVVSPLPWTTNYIKREGGVGSAYGKDKNPSVFTPLKSYKPVRGSPFIADSKFFKASRGELAAVADSMALDFLPRWLTILLLLILIGMANANRVSLRRLAESFTIF